ncbi:hypothetical protein PUN28_020289 [Cardiocondyla obscurior]|uniref:Uncharacterized protein n=1 Tax=Cardiocondyla obscurior TaxID=286306 RepID=A0AAW2E3V2_9HYME
MERQEVKFTSATLSWRSVERRIGRRTYIPRNNKKRSLKVLSSELSSEDWQLSINSTKQQRYADNQDVKRIVVEEEEDLVETQSITVCKNIMSLYTSVNMIGKNSQMPRHLISDAHEWINEIPTVPIYYLAKPLPRERAWKN